MYISQKWQQGVQMSGVSVHKGVSIKDRDSTCICTSACVCKDIHWCSNSDNKLCLLWKIPGCQAISRKRSCALLLSVNHFRREILAKRPPARFRTYYPSTNLSTDLILKNITTWELEFILAISFKLKSFLLNQLISRSNLVSEKFPWEN